MFLVSCVNVSISSFTAVVLVHGKTMATFSIEQSSQVLAVIEMNRAMSPVMTMMKLGPTSLRQSLIRSFMKR